MHAFTLQQPLRRICELRSPTSLFLVVASHATLAWMLLNLTPDAAPIELPKTLTVSLITPEPSTPQSAAPAPTQTQPKQKPQPQQPVQATPAAIPQATQALPAAPVPAPPTIASTSSAPVPSAPTAPAPVSAPRFDAGYLDNPAPPYPGLSRRVGEEGRVLLRVFVHSDGSAAQVELRQSSGFSRLDAAALETVRRWRFVPARQGEENVAAWVLVPITFSLRS